MPALNARSLATAIGVARASIGVAYAIAPTRTHEPIGGAIDSKIPAVRAAGRTFGAREIYTGGSILVLQRIAPNAVGPALAAGVAIDAWDFGAFTLTANYPKKNRIAGGLIAGGFTAFGAWAYLAHTRAGS